MAVTSGKSQNKQPLLKLLSGCYLLILALLPVHALFSVLLTSQFGVERLWQSWKEILILLLVPVAVWALIKYPKTAKTIFGRRINQLILAYTALHFVLWGVWSLELDASLAGLVFNLRFLGIFLLAQLLAELLPKDGLRRVAVKVVSFGGLFAIGFGILQILTSPPEWMSWFGYGPDTIEPYITIDRNSDFVRINSSLRGPNPLGLFLILITSLVASWWFKRPAWLLRQPLALPLISVATPAVLYASHSRSAWLGAVLAVAILSLINLKAKAVRPFVAIGISLLVVIGLTVALNWQSDFVQNTVLHDDPNRGPAEVSTSAHFDASSNGLVDFAESPLGQGPGAAGPASFYGESPKIAENYYLQIGQETGILGLVIFLAICWLVLRSLWNQRKEIMPAVLFASFVGISVANLFLHVWAQDEISLIWWGLAGLWYKPN